MPGRHEAERPSSSPHRPSCTNQKNNDALSYPNVSSAVFCPAIRPGAIVGMPDFERNLYSNKESAKVNAGLAFGGTYHTDKAGDAINWLATNKPAVAMDFSQLTVPIVAPEAPPAVEQLVRRLLRPPPHAFLYGTLSIHWVMGAVGLEHFEFRQSDERYVLARDSALRKDGAGLGISAVYMEWLCGDDEEEGSTEQGIYLTPGFFRELERE